MNESVFRAYDIRGVVGKDFQIEDAKRIGQAYAKLLQRKYETVSLQIAVGRDNRIHSKALQDALIDGLLTMGVSVLKIEDCTTPLLYFVVAHQKLDGGINVTASHNPAEYNGFKMVGRAAHSIAGKEIQKMKEMLQMNIKAPSPSLEPACDRALIQPMSIEERYYDHLLSLLNIKKSFRIVIDAGNGIAGKYYPDFFRRLHCDVIELYCDQDGSFPHHEPDPIVEKNTGDLQKKVIDEGADLGIAYDGDGDRFTIIDEQGHFHDPNETFILLIRDLLSAHPASAVVYTVSCSLLIPQEIKKLGGKDIMVPVGHSSVEEAMRRHGAVLGGEQSGHYFIHDRYYGFDDALYASAKLLEYFSRNDDQISSVYETVQKTFQVPEMRLFCADERKFRVVEDIKKELAKCSGVTINTLDGVRLELPNGSWLGIRASNTSPCLSICLEAVDRASLEELKQLEQQVLSKHLPGPLGSPLP